jgi:hypothetical protein
LWEEVRAVEISPTVTGVVRRRLEEADEYRLLQGFQGYATSLAARRDQPELGDAMEDFGTIVQRYLAAKGRQFTEEVKRKQVRHLSVAVPLPDQDDARLPPSLGECDS